MYSCTNEIWVKLCDKYISEVVQQIYYRSNCATNIYKVVQTNILLSLLVKFINEFVHLIYCRGCATNILLLRMFLQIFYWGCSDKYITEVVGHICYWCYATNILPRLCDKYIITEVVPTNMLLRLFRQICYWGCRPYLLLMLGN